jgi:ATP-binding cassette subfamily C (CFTR/MRP) protein 1
MDIFPELSFALIPHLAFVGFSLAQTYLINATIGYVTYHSRLLENYGYGIVKVYAICYMGLALGIPDT